MRDALGQLAADPLRFHELLTPGAGDGVPLDELERPVVETLARAQVISIADDVARPRLWVTLRGERPYFMSLHPSQAGDGYLQDLWPETDAMIDYVRAAPRGTLLDVGTGSGVVAIEAALAGHTVTATDLVTPMIELARWNAALHGVELELVQGHLFEPVAGRQFDHVVGAPHYTGPADLLRVEALRSGSSCVAPNGALFIATFLEWAEGERPGVVESLLRPLAETGAGVRVAPIRSPRKRRWFTTPAPFFAGAVARHRFTIEIRPDGPGGLALELPGDEDVERQPIVPLARLVGPRADRPGLRAELGGQPAPAATVMQEDDVAALEALLRQCATGVLTIDDPLAFTLVDACRFGARACTEAHGAIVDAAGGVRPCLHGRVVSDVLTSSAEHQRAMHALRVAIEERRGCARCSAQAYCSRCVFGGPLDEARFCDFMRRHAHGLPLLHLVLHALTMCPQLAHARVLRAKLGPSPRLIAAAFRPFLAAAGEPDPLLARVQRAAVRRGVLMIRSDDRAALADGQRMPLEVPVETLALVELMIEGAARPTLYAYALRRELHPAEVDATISMLCHWLGASAA